MPQPRPPLFSPAQSSQGTTACSQQDPWEEELSPTEEQLLTARGRNRRQRTVVTGSYAQFSAAQTGVLMKDKATYATQNSKQLVLGSRLRSPWGQELGRGLQRGLAAGSCLNSSAGPPSPALPPLPVPCLPSASPQPATATRVSSMPSRPTDKHKGPSR